MSEAADSRRRSRAALAALAIGSLLLALLAAEAAVRALAPQQLVVYRPDIWEPYLGLGWVHRAGLDVEINTGERSVRLRTDANGHRIGLEPRAADGVRVLALGDSFLAALQVQYEQTFGARLEDALSTRLGRSVAITNTGVNGWGPNHYLIKARAELARQPYSLVLVFLFMGNDIEDELVSHYSAGVGEPSLPSGNWRTRLLWPVNEWIEQRSHLFVLARHRARLLLVRFKLSP